MSSSNEEVDLDSMLEQVDHGELQLSSHKDVARAAKKTSDKAQKVNTSIASIVLFLKEDEVRNEALEIVHPPGFHDVLQDPTFLDSVRNVMNIADQYKKGDLPDPVTLDQNIIQLAAWQTSLAIRVGYAEAGMNHAETSYKLAQDRYLIKAKEYADAHHIHGSVDLFKATAREAAEEMRAHLGQYMALVHTFRSLYFANKQLIEVMDHAAARLSHERRLPQEG